jgi:hypothetical protein
LNSFFCWFTRFYDSSFFIWKACKAFRSIILVKFTFSVFKVFSNWVMCQLLWLARDFRLLPDFYKYTFWLLRHNIIALPSLYRISFTNHVLYKIKFGIKFFLRFKWYLSRSETDAAFFGFQETKLCLLQLLLNKQLQFEEKLLGIINHKS